MLVGKAVIVGDGLSVNVGIKVGVTLGRGVLVGVSVGVRVGVNVGVLVGVKVGVLSRGECWRVRRPRRRSKRISRRQIRRWRIGGSKGLSGHWSGCQCRGGRAGKSQRCRAQSGGWRRKCKIGSRGQHWSGSCSCHSGLNHQGNPSEAIAWQCRKDDENQNEAKPCSRVVRVAHRHDDNIKEEVRRKMNHKV